MPIESTRYSRLVFVGFGVLSAAEVKLFDHFNKQEKADFWWDNAGIKELLRVAPHDPGALLIDGYCHRLAPGSPIDCTRITLDEGRRVPRLWDKPRLAFDEVIA